MMGEKREIYQSFSFNHQGVFSRRRKPLDKNKKRFHEVKVHKNQKLFYE